MNWTVTDFFTMVKGLRSAIGLTIWAGFWLFFWGVILWTALT